MRMKPLRIGTRGSELALAQTRLTIEALQRVRPEISCEIITITTAGDQRTDIPLHCVNAVTNTADKGVFIAAIEEALAAGEIDCAVHSLKDMPGVLDSRFVLAAVLPREEVQDALVMKAGGDWAAPVIATGSVRRAHLVQTYWQGKARTVPIRGNVATRLRKLAEHDEWSATLLARAGLNRLGYDRHHLCVQGVDMVIESLPVEDFPPALGQGAIAIETRRDDVESTALLSLINDEHTRRCIACEREFLNLLKADCSVPVGGNAWCDDTTGMMHFLVVYYTPTGRIIKVNQAASLSDTTPEELAAQVYSELCLYLSAE